MKRHEFMKIHRRYLPQEIIDAYDLETKFTHDGYIYIRIKKGMYGLKQAARLAYDLLCDRLGKEGYAPSLLSPNIWGHKTRATKFCLCVDDFGIKYFNNDDIYHLLNALKNHYTVSEDWTGENYCGFKLTWFYKKGYVIAAMPNYIKELLKKLKHTAPLKPVHAPHAWTEPAYGQKIQYTKEADQSPYLDTKGIRRIQSIVGSCLYYGRAMDGTILTSLNDIGTQQAQPTQNKNAEADWLLDYLHTHPDAELLFKASDMVLWVDSDAAYLVKPGAKSRMAGFYYLSSHPDKLSSGAKPSLNGAIHIFCKTIPHVMASAAESEMAGLFMNAQEIIPIRHGLMALAHPQPPTPLKTDNSTSSSFIDNSIKQRKSKTWDMRWNWMRDPKTKEQIRTYWDRGVNNLADYPTKHHPPVHHKRMRPVYLHMAQNIFQSIMTNKLRVQA